MKINAIKIVLFFSFLYLFIPAISYSQGTEDIVWVRYFKGDSITYLYNISPQPLTISGDNLIINYNGFNVNNVSNPGIMKLDLNGNILLQKEFISDYKQFLWNINAKDTTIVFSAINISTSEYDTRMCPRIDYLDKDLNTIYFNSDTTNRIFQYGATYQYFTSDSIFIFIDGYERDTSNGYDYRKNRLFFSDNRSLPVQYIRTDQFNKYWDKWVYWSFKDFSIMKDGNILLTVSKSQESFTRAEESEIFILDRAGNILSNTPIKFKEKATEIINCIEDSKGDIICFGYTRIKTEYGYEQKNDSIFVFKMDRSTNIKYFRELELLYQPYFKQSKIKQILNKEYYAISGRFINKGIQKKDSSSYNYLIILDSNGEIRYSKYWKFIDTLQNWIDGIVSYGDRLFVHGTLDETRNWSERYLYIAEIKYNLTDVNQDYDTGYRADFSISPNPASDYIDINLEKCSSSSVWTPSEIQIYNSLGQCVLLDVPHFESVGHLYRIDISGLSPGMYYAVLRDGKDILTNSFIVLR